MLTLSRRQQRFLDEVAPAYRVTGFAHTAASGTTYARPRYFHTPARTLDFLRRSHGTAEVLQNNAWTPITRTELKARI